MEMSPINCKIRMYQLKYLFFYTDGCLSLIQWMKKLKYVDCLSQYESSSDLNETLSR